jgi:ssDNA-specific exonuclease RecJ
MLDVPFHSAKQLAADIRKKKNVVMPLAEQRLTEADWQPIDAAFQANDDLLFGARPREEFKKLFGLILNRAPAPVGVDPSRRAI